MSKGIEMIKQDMVELYRLADLYRSVYGDGSGDGLLEALEKRFHSIWGLDIREERNPRHAGRPLKYGKQVDKMILFQRQSGHTMRQIAAETGCSVGHVQDVLRRHHKSGMYYN